MANSQVEIPLRITLHRVPAGVAFALQKGKSGVHGDVELVQPTSRDRDSLSFDFSVRVEEAKKGAGPRFLGEFTQGPPDKRFVYVNSGRSAGQANTLWNRRAKIPLTTISAGLIDKVLSKAGAILELEIEGTSKDGGPVCASLLSSTEWRPVRK